VSRAAFILLLLTCAAQPRASQAQEEWDVVADEPAGAPAHAAEKETGDAEGDWDIETNGTPPPAVEPRAEVPGNAAGALQEAEDFSLLGSDTLRLSGYLENQASMFQLPRKRTAPDSSGWAVMDYNRLRVDLSARPVRGFRMDADVIARTFHGTTRYDLRDMVASKFDADLDLLAALDPSWVRFDLDDEIFVDNAFLTADAGPFRLRVGKQQMRFGSGYLWNPTDPFNTKDLLDPTYELTGITAVRMQLFGPHEGLLEAYLLPLDRLDEFHAEDVSGVLRARVAVDRWVAAVTYAYFQDLVGLDRITAEQLDARRSLFGVEVTGEIAGIGVWGEGAFNLTDRKQGAVRLQPFGDPSCTKGLDRLCWFEALGGASYTFEGGILVQAEYLYNGRGLAGSDGYELSDWFAYLDQTMRYLGTHYATAMVQIPCDELHFTLTAMAVANLSDHSVLFTPWIQWDWSQYLALTLYGALNHSDDETDEFRAVGQAGYLRLRFSF
jgi:hypothetical protein